MKSSPILSPRWIAGLAGLTVALVLGAAAPALAQTTHTITASASAGGSISPAGSVTTDDGADQAFTIAPDAGYAIYDVQVDGESVGAVTGYTFTNVTADHSIFASFVSTGGVATVDAVSPGGVLSPTTTSVVIPVSISRPYATANRLFHVKFQLAGGLTLAGGTAAITEGTFLSASGAHTNFQVVDHGGGSYTVDASILGIPCNATGLSGNLFQVEVASTAAAGPGTLTITEVALRDCDNGALAAAIGSAASVEIDNTPPTVAVTSPAGGESWLAGSAHAITWSATDASGLGATPVSIDWSADGGLTWAPVAAGLANDGTYPWVVPATLTTDARVRVSATDVHGNTGSGMSAAAFTIHTTTSLEVASDLNPSTLGQPVTFTAVVTPNTATGTVQFSVDGSPVGSPVPVVGGVATAAAIATLAVGPHPVAAAYDGDPTHLASNGSLSGGQLVGVGASSTALAADVNPSVAGGLVTLTATVTATPPAPGIPGGDVTFFDGLAPIGTATLDGAGIATLAVSTLEVGSHALTAQYGGDPAFGPSTSGVLTQVVQAKIVATAGPGGSVSPAGTTFWSPGATPLFTFTPNAGRHVADVLVDGVSVGAPASYLFPPLTQNHTLDVSFAVNPVVTPIASLAASRSRFLNDGSGIENVAVTWPSRPAGDVVDVWRAPFGNYPEYDDPPAAGQAPVIPSYPPPAPWQHTTVTVSGGLDHPASRSAWYYVAFVTDQYGTRSTVSNMTGAVLDYALGDVSDNSHPGLGDNRVDIADVSLLGMHYGISGAALTAWNYLDVGPTTDHSVEGRPLTDNRIDFDDLIMFAVNFEQVTAPAAASRPALVAATADKLELDVPAGFTAGRLTARLQLGGTGAIQGLSTRLTWNASAVVPESFAQGALLHAMGAIALSGQPGVIDIARLGVGAAGLVGTGEVATVTFRRIGEGDPAIAIASVDARSPSNAALALVFTNRSVPVIPAATSFDRATPNPARDRTTLAFALARAGAVELAVFGVDGRLVRMLASGVRDAGSYQVAWDGRDESGRPAPAGIYYARLVTPQGRFTRSLVMLK